MCVDISMFFHFLGVYLWLYWCDVIEAFLRFSVKLFSTVNACLRWCAVRGVPIYKCTPEKEKSVVIWTRKAPRNQGFSNCTLYN